MIITNLAHIAILSNTRRSVRIRAASFTQIELKAHAINFSYAILFCLCSSFPSICQSIPSICTRFLSICPCTMPSTIICLSGKFIILDTLIVLISLWWCTARSQASCFFIISAHGIVDKLLRMLFVNKGSSAQLLKRDVIYEERRQSN